MGGALLPRSKKTHPSHFKTRSMLRLIGYIWLLSNNCLSPTLIHRCVLGLGFTHAHAIYTHTQTHTDSGAPPIIHSLSNYYSSVRSTSASLLELRFFTSCYGEAVITCSPHPHTRVNENPPHFSHLPLALSSISPPADSEGSSHVC